MAPIGTNSTLGADYGGAGSALCADCSGKVGL